VPQLGPYFDLSVVILCGPESSRIVSYADIVGPHLAENTGRILDHAAKGISLALTQGHDLLNSENPEGVDHPREQSPNRKEDQA
jgi:hypothetical protein